MKSSLTFKKYEASASTIENVCLNQKHTWDTRGIEYKAKPTKSEELYYNKPIKFVLEDKYKSSYFVSTCHDCDIRGHIRPRYHKLYELPMDYVQIRNHQNQGRSYNGQMSNRFRM